jgi:hypothetical protein
MWLERKIMSRVTGDDRYFDFDAQIGWNHLKVCMYVCIDVHQILMLVLLLFIICCLECCIY